MPACFSAGLSIVTSSMRPGQQALPARMPIFHITASGEVVKSSRHWGNPNTLLSVYVDILGDHEQLQAFCLSHEALLRGTSLYFKPAESWRFGMQPTP